MNNPGSQKEEIRGKVIYRTRGYYYILDNEGVTHECRLKRRMFYKSDEKPDPVPGDRVCCLKDDKHTSPLIYEILERETVLRRRKPTRNEWLTIAANINVLLIITPLCQPNYNYLFTVRLITEANACKIVPVIVLTKADLITKPEISKTLAVFQELNMPVFITGENLHAEIAALKVYLKNNVCAFCGVSGAGKSSLINMMFKNLDIKTGEINFQLNFGRHTTSMTRLYEPESGYSVIDSPGIRNFEFYETNRQTLKDNVPLIRDYQGLCKMRDCLHNSENGCAVKKAVEQSKISVRVYDSYLKILSMLNPVTYNPK